MNNSKFDKYRLFDIVLVKQGGNWKGLQSALYKIIPLNPSKVLRCHHILHGFFIYNVDCKINLITEPIKNYDHLWKLLQEHSKTYDIYDTDAYGNDTEIIDNLVCHVNDLYKKNSFVKGIYNDQLIIFTNKKNESYIFHCY